MPKTYFIDDGSPPPLYDLQKLVRGYIEVLYTEKRQFVVNEEGRLVGLEVNEEASEEYGSELVGNVVILSNGAKLK